MRMEPGAHPEARATSAAPRAGCRSPNAKDNLEWAGQEGVVERDDVEVCRRQCFAHILGDEGAGIALDSGA